MIRCEFDSENKTLNCIFDGRMDGPTSMEADKHLQLKLEEVSAATAQPSLKVVFDMNSVEYIASAFIRLCLQTAKTVDSGNFSITNTNPFIKKTFKMAGLDQALNVR